MNSKAKKIRLMVFLVIIISGAILWWVLGSDSSDLSTDISTSGFIEARDVAISLETGGRIAYIAADEGDSIKAGVTLVKLDDSLLKAQQQQAEVNVKLAQAQLATAIISRDGAKKAWENTLDVQRNPLELEAKIIAARGQLDIAGLSLSQANDTVTQLTYPYSYSTFTFDVPAALADIGDAQRQVSEAQELLKAGSDSTKFQEGLNQLKEAGKNLVEARERLARGQGDNVFEEQFLPIRDFWTLKAAELQVKKAESSLANTRQALQNLLDIRNNPQEINAAVDQAHTVHQTAIAAVATAESRVEQSQASLAIIEVQLAKLTASSPISGTVAARHAEIGEIAQPGAPILTITELAEVTLTAYVPESKIGLIKLGQAASVSIDSYPGESFAGKVTYISPRALFTPRNIQLKEEREKMVFAIKISLDNPEQKLKPGMPADALILIDDER